MTAKAVLLKDRDDLVAKWNAVQGSDQRAAGQRAAITRKVTLAENLLIMEGIDFEPFEPPTKTRKSGPTDDFVIARIAGDRKVLESKLAKDHHKAAAQKELERYLAIAQERGLIEAVAA
jgi:hypothetical protein